MAINILVVDDAPSMRKIIIKTINISGDYAGEIYQAGNGKEALEVLNREWVDLVFTDLNMPVMNGMELIKRIKENPDFENLPIIVITSRGKKDLEGEEQLLLIADFITKPFHPEQLRDVIFSIIGDEYERNEDDVGSDGSDF
ncbi:MAG: response regulator [Candidatus Cloacimonadota bacterium]|nr:response regulator [Candidatus Cloacimonadota bacterium]